MGLFLLIQLIDFPSSVLDVPIKLHDVILFFVGVGASVAVVRELWHRFQPNRKVEFGIERISYHFRTRKTVHIFGCYDEVPTIEVIGRFVLTEEEKRVQGMLPVPKDNDPHAVLDSDPDWSQPRLHFTVKSLEFHEVQALRHAREITRGGFTQARAVRVVSANSIILCRESKQLILHYRSKESSTYPLCYHTIGGGYMPPGIGPKDDLYSLENTLAREVEEEVRAKLTFDRMPRLLIMEESQTGFVQVAFLGMAISAEQANHLPDNPRPVEGKPKRVHFDDLPDLLKHPDWVPTGKAAVLAWLALGAPGAGPYARFGKYSANKLCEEILATPAH
jgi:hypothetical protein